MKPFKALVALFLGITVSVAAAEENAQYAPVLSRTYEKANTVDLIAVTEMILTLADGRHFVYSYGPDGMTARRYWQHDGATPVSGVDVWKITVKKAPVGATASISVETSIDDGPAEPVSGNALHDLFWARMDFITGNARHWMTCGESTKRISEKTVSGSNAPLCDPLTVKDDVPPWGTDSR